MNIDEIYNDIETKVKAFSRQELEDLFISQCYAYKSLYQDNEYLKQENSNLRNELNKIVFDIGRE